MKLRRVRLVVSLITLLLVLEFCTSNNNNNNSDSDSDSWTNSDDKRIIQKLRKDFRKLKKQEGALKLTGSENGDYEGTGDQFFVANLA